MNGYQKIKLRSLSRDSLTTIHQLWQSAATFDACSESVLDEKIFGDPFVSDELRVGAFKADELIGFAVGSVQNNRSFVKLIAVRSDRQRAGVGSLLLNAVHAICQQQAVTIRVGESAPNYLCPGIDQRNQPAIHFFRKLGYLQFGEAHNQTVDVASRVWNSEAEERRLLELFGIAVDRAAPIDFESLGRLLQDHWPSWNGEVQVALSNQPPSLHVAKSDDTVIAFAAHDANNRGTGWFGPMGTDPGFTGKGIGRVLLFRCLSDIRKTQKQATIPWVGPLGFYEKLADAKLDRSFFRFEKQFSRPA